MVRPVVAYCQSWAIQLNDLWLLIARAGQYSSMTYGCQWPELGNTELSMTYGCQLPELRNTAQ
jgi:hypothetical protein